MIAVTARKALQLRLERRQARGQRQATKPQPLKSFSSIFQPAREWTLPPGDKDAQDALTPPSGARATMRLLDL